MTRLTKTASLFALAAAALAAAPAAAQSVLASSGLGYPLPPLDARAVGLGGLWTGLPGAQLSLVNPASIGGIIAPAFAVTYQPDFYRAEGDQVDADGTTSRFPAIQAAFPFRGVSLMVGYGSYLDQHWQARFTDSIDIGGTRRERVDRFVSDGAVARFRVGAAYRFGERLSLGAAADLLTGGAQDTVARAIAGLQEFRSATTYRYNGVGFAAGAQWTPSGALNLGAAVSGGGRLVGDIEDDSVEVRREYATPLTVDAGASARVTQNTLLALSGRWAGWSAADGDLAASGGARDAFSGAGGVEYEGLRFAGRVIPLRLGARYAQLPFRWEGAAGGDNDFPTERAVTAGLGTRFTSAGGIALVDVAGERGWRGGDAAGFDESFWRISLTLSLLAR